GYAVPAGPQPAGTVLALHPTPPSGQQWSAWTHSSGTGSLAAGTPRYTFTVGSGAATVTDTFQEIQAPVITAQPLNRNILPVLTATFTVTAAGPGLSYQWRKNGVALANGGN